MNGEYIKAIDLQEVIDLTRPHLIKAGRVTKDMDESTKGWIEDVISLYKDQLGYGAEIVELTDLFFKEEVDYEEAAQEVLQDEQVIEVFQVITDRAEDGR